MGITEQMEAKWDEMGAVKAKGAGVSSYRGMDTYSAY